MLADKIPHNALVVVADGTGARFFRNSGHENKVSVSARRRVQGRQSSRGGLCRNASTRVIKPGD